MDNTVIGPFVISPSSELRPYIRIAPFSNSFFSHDRYSSDFLEQRFLLLNKLFDNVYVMPKARLCLEECLSSLKVNKDDNVTILTTSGNSYVSSCVTKTIEKYCSWTRSLSKNTKVILVIHEFGYPFKRWDEISALGIPIIEDCAYTFLSNDANIGKYSDFVFYSIPKTFPSQLGGLLVSRNPLDIKQDKAIYEYVLSALCPYVDKLNSIAERRLSNYRYMCRKLSNLGISPYFNLDEGVVPGVFLFSWRDDIDYPLLRTFMERNGIECSVFYGKNAFYVPIHQGLSQEELDYMICLLTYFSEVYV